jgi:tetratricopeptide (TPR) repeat protein
MDCIAARETADIRSLLSCGLACQKAGRHPDAVLCYESVLYLDPRHFDALHMLGVVAIQNRQYERAWDLISGAVQKNARVGAAHRNLALVNLRLGRVSEAASSYQTAIALEPEALDAHIHLASVLIDLNRPEEALTACEQAIRRHPDSAVAYLVTAIALRSLQRATEALMSCDRAIALRPHSAEAWDKRAAALQDLNRLDEAIESCETAMTLRPDFAPAYAHAGLMYLQRGDFFRGWNLSEWRNRPGSVVAAPTYSQPRWRGEDDIVGQTLLVYCEQGLGDTIQFCRYASGLKALGIDVVLLAPSTLHGLLKGLRPTVQIIDERDQLPRFDRHCPLLSIPHALGTTAATIPATIPYLFAEPDRVRRWQTKLCGDDLKIGICWHGSSIPAAVGRSVPLAMFHHISLVPGVRLISLQKGPGSEQLGQLPQGMTVEDLGADFDAGPDSFLDTAAVMQCVDLIITIDTSIAHLAGALGRPTWVMLKEVPDWRWMLKREDSPWYPRHRLFRQQKSGDWQGVFIRILHSVENTIHTLRS